MMTRLEHHSWRPGGAALESDFDSQLRQLRASCIGDALQESLLILLVPHSSCGAEARRLTSGAGRESRAGFNITCGV